MKTQRAAATAVFDEHSKYLDQLPWPAHARGLEPTRLRSGHKFEPIAHHEITSSNSSFRDCCGHALHERSRPIPLNTPVRWYKIVGICGACGLSSVEELVAEMGAAVLCVIARIANMHTDRNTDGLHPKLDLQAAAGQSPHRACR
jgi:hypothetical protein